MIASPIGFPCGRVTIRWGNVELGHCDLCFRIYQQIKKGDRFLPGFLFDRIRLFVARDWCVRGAENADRAETLTQCCSCRIECDFDGLSSQLSRARDMLLRLNFVPSARPTGACDVLIDSIDGEVLNLVVCLIVVTGENDQVLEFY